jgi:hypothetical protein
MDGEKVTTVEKEATHLELGKCERHPVPIAANLHVTLAKSTKHSSDGLRELLVGATIDQTDQCQRLENAQGECEEGLLGHKDTGFRWEDSLRIRSGDLLIEAIRTGSVHHAALGDTESSGRLSATTQWGDFHHIAAERVSWRTSCVLDEGVLHASVHRATNKMTRV